MLESNTWLEAFRRNDRGTVAIIFSLSVMVLLGTTGLAIDASRAYSASTRVGTVLDAAALAGAKLLDRPNTTDAEIRARSLAFLQAHTQALNVQGLSLSNFQTIINRSQSSVKVTIDVNVPTTIANIAGIPNFAFTKTTKVVYGLKRVELAMVLDITGSMGSHGKLSAMKAAAKEVIDLMIDPTASASTTNKVALVPYAASVNVGSYLASVASGQSVMADTCVIERSGDASRDDRAPGGSYRANVMSTLNHSHNSDYHYSCPSSSIMPLSSNISSLKREIDSYDAGGFTSGHMGAAWGWYLISPNWAGIWGGASSPAAYDDRNVIKAVLIMTDGFFNTAYKGSNVQPAAVQTAESYDEFAALCSNMKAQKIQVYTVGFALAAEAEPGQTTARNALRSCASSSSQFFDAESDSALQSAFRSIAEQLISLMIAS